MTGVVHYLKPPLVQHAAYDGVCPHCNGAVYRVHRQPFDRFINFFMPVYRYRCGSLGCSWEGNLRMQQYPQDK